MHDDRSHKNTFVQDETDINLITSQKTTVALGILVVLDFLVTEGNNANKAHFKCGKQYVPRSLFFNPFDSCSFTSIWMSSAQHQAHDLGILYMPFRLQFVNYSSRWYFLLAGLREQ